MNAMVDAIDMIKKNAAAPKRLLVRSMTPETINDSNIDQSTTFNFDYNLHMQLIPSPS